MKSIVMPGMYFRKSPGLLSRMLPNSSAATTLLIEEAKRCSLIAMAAASISFEVETTNWSSLTRRPAWSGAEADAAAVEVRVKSRAAVEPAGTATRAVCWSWPVKKTRTRASPLGTEVSRNWPRESVKVSSVVPSTVTRASSAGSPVRRWVTRPSMVPVAAVCADAESAKNRSASSGVRQRETTRGRNGFMGSRSLGPRAWRASS